MQTDSVVQQNEVEDPRRVVSLVVQCVSAKHMLFRAHGDKSASSLKGNVSDEQVQMP